MAALDDSSFKATELKLMHDEIPASSSFETSQSKRGSITLLKPATLAPLESPSSQLSSPSTVSPTSISSPSRVGPVSSKSVVGHSPSTGGGGSGGSGVMFPTSASGASTVSRGSSRTSSRASSRPRDGEGSDTESEDKEGEERRRINGKRGSSVKSPYEKNRLCHYPSPCMSRPKKRFSRSDRKLMLNSVESEIFINEFFPLEISLDSNHSFSTDLKLRMELRDASTQKPVKEPALEIDEATPLLIPKGLFAATVRIKLNKLALKEEESKYYLKVRGDHVASAVSNKFTVIARYRVVVVGDQGVGKSWLVDEYLQEIHQGKKEYGDDYEKSRLLGGEGDPDSKTRARGGDGKIMREIQFQVEVKNKPVHILLFDTSGDKNFRNQLFVLNQETDFALLCFSVVDYESYDHLLEWKEEIMKLAPKAAIGVLGLKKDIRDRREGQGDSTKQTDKPDILEEWGLEWVTRNGAVFYAECSTKEPESIEQAFKKMFLYFEGDGAQKRGTDRSCSTCLIS